jgi:hypothetical protein
VSGEPPRDLSDQDAERVFRRSDEPARLVAASISAHCPHCGEAIDLYLRLDATIAPPTQLPFDNAHGFARWLQASGLTIGELQRLPFYTWHEDRLEPLVRQLLEHQASSATPPRP